VAVPHGCRKPTLEEVELFQWPVTGSTSTSPYRPVPDSGYQTRMPEQQPRVTLQVHSRQVWRESQPLSVTALFAYGPEATEAPKFLLNAATWLFTSPSKAWPSSRIFWSTGNDAPMP